MTKTIRKIIRYVAFAVLGYILAFIGIFLVLSILNVSGWYVVYIPFLSILGGVVGLFFVNLKSPADNKIKGVRVNLP